MKDPIESSEEQYFEEESLPDQLMEFSEALEKGGSIEINETAIGKYHEWMGLIVDREKAYGKVWEHLEKQNKHLLTPLQINNHGKEHGNRVAGLTGLLYLSIRGPQKLKKIQNKQAEQERGRASHRLIRSLIAVAEPAGQMHDVGYSMSLKGKGIAEIRRVLSSGRQREELPAHAEYGASLVNHGLEKIYKQEERDYREFFQEKYANVLLWKDGRYHNSLNQCVRAVRQHTSQQIKAPITAQQTSGDLPLLVFCADKLDFINRVPEAIDHSKLFEKGPQVHQRLNLAITGQSIQVSGEERHVNLTLNVDPNIPEFLALGKGTDTHYSNEEFEKEFWETYGGSFEEIETIFKVLFTKDIVFDEYDLNHSTFSVNLRFPGARECGKIFIGRRDEHKTEVAAEEVSAKFLERMNL